MDGGDGEWCRAKRGVAVRFGVLFPTKGRKTKTTGETRQHDKWQSRFFLQLGNNLNEHVSQSQPRKANLIKQNTKKKRVCALFYFILFWS